MERSEAEAVYDAGREACVEFLLDLSSRGEREVAQLRERVVRLEEQARASSRNSSQPPSSDPPKTRQQRRAEARAKAKELLKGEGKREAGAQPGHRGSGRKLLPEDQIDEIIDLLPGVGGVSVLVGARRLLSEPSERTRHGLLAGVQQTNWRRSTRAAVRTAPTITAAPDEDQQSAGASR